ncbi:hypothetical protein D0Z03_001709 [Geotrichum reessii]|nr:hypothetical protein D0Z03_001709 [Galactomyces reessii]
MPGLLTSQSLKGLHYLVIGWSNLTPSRVTTLVEHGVDRVIVAGVNGVTATDAERATAAGASQVLDRPFKIEDLNTLGRDEVDNVIDGVFVTLPKIRFAKEIEQIYARCLRLRVPVNVADAPEFCTFTLLSSYTRGDFQVGVTTNGKGCRLASRIKREVVKSLPVNIDEICACVGALRQRIYEEDLNEVIESAVGHEDDDAGQSQEFNTLVLEHEETLEQRKKQRLRWLSQVVEYYPLSRLGSISVDELSREYKQSIKNKETNVTSLPDTAKRGRIALVGSGPGNSGLLTAAALQAITSADVVLADKLVPEEVLALIPRRTPVRIAKKFPGNAERAQQELLQLGLEGLEAGQYVVRLKQGDPYIFGRGAEEFNYFRSQGYIPDVVPGITSALSAPLVAKIPVTHREVADQVLICTGTGRRGALPTIPEWVESRTCVFLMTLHRIGSIVEALAEKGWDLSVPCCVIERASCPDQRIIRTRLRDVAEALETAGSRPPGLLVTGYACEVIEKLGEEKWKIEEGLGN